MATTAYSRHKILGNGTNYLVLDVVSTSNNSPRVNGKLKLEAQNWNLTVVKREAMAERSRSSITAINPWTPIVRSNPKIQRAIAVTESDLRGAFVRKAKNKNVGSLGVTIATAGQSIKMMAGAGTQLTRIFAAAEHFYRTSRGRKRLKRLRRLANHGGVPTAGLVLEGFFGWAPLFEDFSNAAATASNPWPPGWVSSKAHWKTNGLQLATGTTQGYCRWTAKGHSTYSAGIKITNPNVWLANKLGLLNLPGIAWDLVPWSFLVNMVSNMGQVMGSLTDLAGLSLIDPSLTRGVYIEQSSYTYRKYPAASGDYAYAQVHESQKARTRTKGAPLPSVVPYIRFPTWDVGAAAIVGALLVQQTSRLSRLLKLG